MEVAIAAPLVRLGVHRHAVVLSRTGSSARGGEEGVRLGRRRGGADRGHRSAVVRVLERRGLHVHLEDGGALILEKPGLTRARDHRVEELGPLRRLVLAARAVHEVIHDDVGEIPKRVGQQEDLLAR